MSVSIDRRSYSAPLSYVGSARRLSGWGRRFHGWPSVGTWTLVVFAVLAMWAVVTFWYVLTFGLLWFVMIPFRLIRRSQRRSRHLSEAQLEALQAIQRKPAS